MSAPLPLTDANGTLEPPSKPTPPPSSSTTAPPAAPPLTEPWSVQSVLVTLATPPPPSPSTPIPFLHLLTRLKTTPREGWRRHHIPHPESIADHMYRMSIITLLAPPTLTSKLNIPHCTKMALVHDMAESLVGDITPVDPVSKEEKSRRERETMEFLSRGLLGVWGGGGQGEGIRQVWEEYEEGRTLESVFVHDVDKFELLLQMVEYERMEREGEEAGGYDFGEFAHVAKKIQLEEVKVWAREVLREREEFWKGLGKVPKMANVLYEI